MTCADDDRTGRLQDSESVSPVVGLRGEGDARQNTDPPKRSWWWVDELHPFERSLHLPWFNRHRPFVVLHVSQWGHNLYGGRERRILHVQLVWGRLFTDRGRSKVWHPHGRWSRG